MSALHVFHKIIAKSDYCSSKIWQVFFSGGTCGSMYLYLIPSVQGQVAWSPGQHELLGVNPVHNRKLVTIKVPSSPNHL